MINRIYFLLVTYFSCMSIIGEQNLRIKNDDIGGSK